MLPLDSHVGQSCNAENCGHCRTCCLLAAPHAWRPDRTRTMPLRTPIRALKNNTDRNTLERILAIAHNEHEDRGVLHAIVIVRGNCDAANDDKRLQLLSDPVQIGAARQCLAPLTVDGTGKAGHEPDSWRILLRCVFGTIRNQAEQAPLHKRNGRHRRRRPFVHRMRTSSIRSSP